MSKIQTTRNVIAKLTPNFQKYGKFGAFMSFGYKLNREAFLPSFCVKCVGQIARLK